LPLLRLEKTFVWVAFASVGRVCPFLAGCVLVFYGLTGITEYWYFAKQQQQLFASSNNINTIFGV